LVYLAILTTLPNVGADARRFLTLCLFNFAF